MSPNPMVVAVPEEITSESETAPIRGPRARRLDPDRVKTIPIPYETLAEVYERRLAELAASDPMPANDPEPPTTGDVVALAEQTAEEILAEVRDAALAQLSFRRARLEKALVRANPRQAHDLRRRRDLIEMAIEAAERI